MTPSQGHITKTFLMARRYLKYLRYGILKEPSLLPCFIIHDMLFIYTSSQWCFGLLTLSSQGLFAKVKNWNFNSMRLPGTAGYSVPERLVSVSGLFCKIANFNPTEYLLTNINCCQPSVSLFIPYLFFNLKREMNADILLPISLGSKKTGNKCDVPTPHSPFSPESKVNYTGQGGVAGSIKELNHWREMQSRFLQIVVSSITCSQNKALNVFFF